jgi:hypothetical protein
MPYSSPLSTRPPLRLVALLLAATTSLVGCGVTGASEPGPGSNDTSSNSPASPSETSSPTLIGTYDEGYDLGYQHGSGTGARATAAFLAERTTEFRQGYDAGYTTGKDEAEAAETNPVTSFGSTMEWEDGLTLTVTNDGSFTPDEWASVGDFPTYLSFTFTVTNGTSTTWDASAYAQITSAGTAGDEVYDSDQGYGGAPSSPVLPGQSITWKQGFGVTDPADLTMSVTVDWEHVDVVYTTVEDAWTF